MDKFRQISTELLPFIFCRKFVSVLYIPHFLADCLQTVYEFVFRRSGLGL